LVDLVAKKVLKLESFETCIDQDLDLDETKCFHQYLGQKVKNAQIPQA